MESLGQKELYNKLNEKFSEIFPVKDIYLISLNITSRKAIILTIMKKGGVSIDDCRIISKIVNQYIPQDYDLQVGSPGIGFEIRKENFKFLELFYETPVKVFYQDQKDGKDIVYEESGILVFVDKSLFLKKFEKENKKNKDILIDNEIKESIPIEKVIKIKTIFFPEEI